MIGTSRRARSLRSLVQAHFFCGDLQAFFPAGERAVQLNPNDSTALATVGMLTAFAGEWDRGVAMLRKAIALNPHHPGWYHLPMAISLYRRADYGEALKLALQVNMPGYYPAQMILTALYGQLGRNVEATAAAAKLLAISPDFLDHGVERIARWQHDESLRAMLVEGLSKAGLKLAHPQKVPAGSDVG